MKNLKAGFFSAVLGGVLLGTAAISLGGALPASAASPLDQPRSTASTDIIEGTSAACADPATVAVRSPINGAVTFCPDTNAQQYPPPASVNPDPVPDSMVASE